MTYNLTQNSGSVPRPAEGSLAACSVIVLLATGCGLTNIRLGTLQPADFVLLALLAVCVAYTIGACFSLRFSSRIRTLLTSYSLLFLSLVLLAALAIRLKFYPLDNAPFLKRPVLLSLSKLLQLAAVLCGFLWLTNAFVKHRKLLHRALHTYWWAGIVWCLYAIVCYAALSIYHFTVEYYGIFGAYTNIDDVARARGFFNEGGPFGIYVASVFVIGVLRRRVTGKRLGLLNSLILLAAFFLSSSKAGLFAAIFLMFFFLFFGAATSLRVRLYSLILAVCLFAGAAVWLDLGEQLTNHLLDYANVDEHGNDINYITGRISALYIVPRMIMAHPLTGIGFGNYPLMRNDPDYLGSLPPFTEEDLPGLGIPALAAEMGIPIAIWLMVLLFRPYRLCRRKASIVAVAAIFQPIAHTFGLQLTFFYPWFITACALGAASYEEPLYPSNKGK